MKKHNKSSHKSVALVYNDALPAPVILAKGRGLMAERIDSIAKEAGVPFAIDQAFGRGAGAHGCWNHGSSRILGNYCKNFNYNKECAKMKKVFC